jgi:hypothetical protein
MLNFEAAGKGCQNRIQTGHGQTMELQFHGWVVEVSGQS